MSEFTTRDYRQFAADKFNNGHKQYKVYLEKQVDAEVIEALERTGNKASLIRKALRFYIRETKKKQEAEA